MALFVSMFGRKRVSPDCSNRRLTKTTGVDGRRKSCVVVSWVVCGVGLAVVADVDSDSHEVMGQCLVMVVVRGFSQIL